MEQEKIKQSLTPEAWAIRLSKIVKVFHEVHGLDRFPINVKDVAYDFSKNVYPDAPITFIKGDSFKKFEGALIPHPDKNGEWGILYNSAISSSGRINFTISHELGHYLLHRHLSGDPKYCSRRDMWEWNSEYGKMETEANQFASYLLMPLDDFKNQVKGLFKPTINDFEGIRDRYNVSLTAAILKWLDITKLRAMIVVSKDGFIDWSWSSKPLLRTRVYFKAKQTVISLPDNSLAAGNVSISNPSKGTLLGPDIWWKDEEVYESVIFSEYHDMAISLLIFPNDPPDYYTKHQDEYEEPDPTPPSIPSFR